METQNLRREVRLLRSTRGLLRGDAAAVLHFARSGGSRGAVCCPSPVVRACQGGGQGDVLSTGWLRPSEGWGWWPMRCALLVRLQSAMGGYEAGSPVIQAHEVFLQISGSILADGEGSEGGW
jgi:hypothetical protein